MAKNTMLNLRRNSEEIALDYDKAMNEWSRVLSNARNQSIEELSEVINDNLESFRKINSSGTWEDAMVWGVFLYHYDAHTGLQSESGFHLQQVTDALRKSNCSEYVKRTIDYAYYVLQDKKMNNSY